MCRGRKVLELVQYKYTTRARNDIRHTENRKKLSLIRSKTQAPKTLLQ